MIGTPELSTQRAFTAAVIPLDIPRDEMSAVMPPAIAELRHVIAEQGLRVTGSMFCHHVRLSRERFTFEVGFPVATEVRAAGRVTPAHYPELRIAHVVHTGPYEQLFKAWTAFEIWIEAARLTTASTLFERYVRGPESGAPPAEWETELIRPLA
jgi:effector-binding domain-containing protein